MLHECVFEFLHAEIINYTAENEVTTNKIIN